MRRAAVIVYLGMVGLAAGAEVPAAEGWTAVPLVSAEQRAAESSGGEGCQWLRSMAVGPEGQRLLYGTDVGGLWRSLDGGRSWLPSNVGYHPRGTAAVAFDPADPLRVFSVGANSSVCDLHGIYLSEDGAASWRRVLEAKISGVHDINRRQLAFDPTSIADGRTGRVYWSRLSEDKPMWGEVTPAPMVYRSDDGGVSWNELPGTAAQAGGEIGVDLEGVVLAANDQGLWRSADHGATFTRLHDLEATGLQVSTVAPGRIWLSTADTIFRSTDGGTTLTPIIQASELSGNGPIRHLRASPADEQRLAFWRQGEHWRWPRFVSHDGGSTVHQSVVDGSSAFMPTNARQHFATWHPTDPDVIWSTGGDYPTVSRDGGRTFVPSSDGQNAILVGGRMVRCLHDPDVLFVASQDYNGAVTTDGGATWRYANVSGHGWGGFTYGGYAIDARTLICGEAAGWGGDRILHVSRDGGSTWSDTGLGYEGADAAYGDPRDPQVAFAGSLRSTDGGGTWGRMTGCHGVFAHDGQGRLYGARRGDRHAIVSSDDHGANWTVLAELDGTVHDLAVGTSGTVWVVESETHVRRLDEGGWTTIANLPGDQWGNPRANAIAVDPADERIVYVGRARNVFMSSAGVMRSTDGGDSWEVLTASQPLADDEADGGREAISLHVHPQTRELWVATSCMGIWRHPPP